MLEKVKALTMLLFEIPRLRSFPAQKLRSRSKALAKEHAGPFSFGLSLNHAREKERKSPHPIERFQPSRSKLQSPVETESTVISFSPLLPFLFSSIKCGKTHRHFPLPP